MIMDVVNDSYMHLGDVLTTQKRGSLAGIILPPVESQTSYEQPCSSVEAKPSRQTQTVWQRHKSTQCTRNAHTQMPRPDLVLDTQHDHEIASGLLRTSLCLVKVTSNADV